MSYDVTTPRVSQTGPLDSQLCTPPTQTQTPSVPPHPNAFGNDQHQVNQPTDVCTEDPTAVTFQDIPTTNKDGAVTVLISKADLAISTATPALKAADDAIAASNNGSATYRTLAKDIQLKNAKDGVGTAIQTVDKAIDELKSQLASVPTDNPHYAELTDRLTQLQTLKTQLTDKLKAVTNRTKEFHTTVDANNTNHADRVAILNKAKNILGDSGLTATQKAAAIGNLIKEYQENGPTDASVALLKDIQTLVKGGLTLNAKTELINKIRLEGEALAKDHVHLCQDEGGALAALANASQSSAPIAAAPNRTFTVPQVKHYDPSTDADMVSRNEEITKSYDDLETAMQAYLGTNMHTWLAMGANASGECGKQMARSAGGDLVQAVSHPVCTTEALCSDATMSGFWKGLAAGNREIYNTIAPAMKIFLEAEKRGEDGVEALKHSQHFANLKNDHDPEHKLYGDTEVLLKAFQALQSAARTNDPQKKADFIKESIKDVAIYEQKNVLQPVLDRESVKGYIDAVSPIMQWTPPGASEKVNLLPDNGSHWGDYNTRINAILSGPAAWFDKFNRTQSH